MDSLVILKRPQAANTKSGRPVTAQERFLHLWKQRGGGSIVKRFPVCLDKLVGEEEQERQISSGIFAEAKHWSQFVRWDWSLPKSWSISSLKFVIQGHLEPANVSTGLHCSTSCRLIYVFVLCIYSRSRLLVFIWLSWVNTSFLQSRWPSLG